MVTKNYQKKGWNFSLRFDDPQNVSVTSNIQQLMVDASTTYSTLMIRSMYIKLCDPPSSLRSQIEGGLNKRMGGN